MWAHLFRTGRQAAFLVVVAGGLPGGCGALAAADPLTEIKAASGLEGLDAAKLRRGEIITGRGTQGSFGRGVYAESCYFLQAAPEAVQRTLLHWNPSTYKETEVSAYATYHWPAGSPEAFKTFALNEKTAVDRTLLDWTVAAGTRGEAGELHLRPDEVAGFRQAFAGRDLAPVGAKAAAASVAWQGLLARHSEAVGGGGFAALPSYKAADGATIQAAGEIRSLLKMTPKVAARFTPLTGARGLLDGGGTTAQEIVPYAEESLVRGHTSFCLGAMAAMPTPGETTGFLVLDCSYYTTDTYFLSFSLYQAWPWEGGTLVWEVDYASAPFRSYLGGVDRVFAGREMTKDSTGAVATFRKELAKGAR